jgi:small ligand-binding sensory domain FIST
MLVADGESVMPFAAALSTKMDTEQALDEAGARALDEFQGPPDLGLVFFSPHHHEAAERIAARLQDRVKANCLLGCGGESIVGNDREVEGGPAMCLWLGRWKEPVELTPFHMMVEATPDGHSLLGWPDELTAADPKESVVLLLGDPYTFPVDEFLRQVNERHPGLRVVGGMASGASEPGMSRLLLGNRVLEQGAVGVLLRGPAKVRCIVSQGCRPVGRHLVVTRGKDNIIAELGGKPPLAQLQELWQELPPRDRQLFQRGLHVGRVINEYQGEFHRGDFLVRNLMGLDQASGALAITDRVRVGQTVQFHVRDAASADEDLHELLQIDLSAHESRPAGALLFTCNGRGTRLFAEPDHDAKTVRAEAGAVPLAGFFAAGELGPVGGQNFIHGFTASVVLFED